MTRMTNFFRFVLAAFAAAAFVSCCSESTSVIRTQTPERPAGQEDMIGYAAPAIDTVRVGFVGGGARGKDAVRRFHEVPFVKVAAIC